TGIPIVLFLSGGNHWDKRNVAYGRELMMSWSQLEAVSLFTRFVSSIFYKTKWFLRFCCYGTLNYDVDLVIKNRKY
ncbi:hypothetical protein MKX01_021061, partial [Papaver californicum]